MFEELRYIPRALSGHPGDDPRSVEKAILWFLQQAQAVGGTPLLVVPTRDIDGFDAPLVALARRVRTETPRTMLSARWEGGPVLASWLGQDEIAKLDGNRRTSALCVLAWIPEEAAAWASAHQPERLSDGLPEPSSASTLDPVVVAALESVTRHMNQANGLSGYGRDAAVQALKILRAAGYPLPTEDIYAWSLAAGWRPRSAGDLRDLVDTVNAGRHPRARRQEFRDDILTIWREQASRPPE